MQFKNKSFKKPPSPSELTTESKSY